MTNQNKNLLLSSILEVLVILIYSDWLMPHVISHTLRAKFAEHDGHRLSKFAAKLKALFNKFNWKNKRLSLRKPSWLNILMSFLTSNTIYNSLNWYQLNWIFKYLFTITAQIDVLTIFMVVWYQMRTILFKSSDSRYI